ncbi:MAG: hypothetical protein IJZ90_00075 [Clostridia bacterium]|nr:hypothetical protein [Clostridia bacterium]
MKNNDASSMKKINWKKSSGIVLFVTLLFSIGYSIVKIITSDTAGDKAHELVRSDYVLMLLQCTLGIIVMFLPSIIQKKFSIEIPNYMTILYFVFLYCAIYLGEVHSFYYVIPYWDSILHAFSGAMLGVLGFVLVDILNSAKNISVKLSPFFVALFAFCFALAVGSLWEVYEFCGDHLFGLNMQKFRTAEGIVLTGHSALTDTMKDIIIDTGAALAISVLGYFSFKKRDKK